MNHHDIRLFALDASRPFGERVAKRLGIALCEHEERVFEDGEHKTRPLVSVRDRDVFVIQSLYSDQDQSVDDKLCRLLFFIACLKEGSAARVTAVVPYLAYARKDRKTQPHDPVITRYLAILIESMGTDRIITLDVHNLAAYQNAFRCGCEHLEATPLFLEHFLGRVKAEDKITVVSPDAGGVKRARAVGDALAGALGTEIAFAFVEKSRNKGVVRIGELVGDVRGRTVVIIDDLISTGCTLLGAARACRDAGAKKIYAAASHGSFVSDAAAVLEDDALDQVVVTDTIPPFRLDQGLIERKLTVLPASDLFAEAIGSLHDGTLVERQLT